MRCFVLLAALLFLTIPANSQEIIAPPLSPPDENPPTTQTSPPPPAFSIIEKEEINPALLTPDEAKTVLREKILASPETLKVLHGAGFQVQDILEDKWQHSPLKNDRLIRIDRAQQRVFVFAKGLPKYIFKCSTSLTGRVASVGVRKGVHDHVGIFKILSKERRHRSRQYGVMMPYAQRFVEGHFLHQTYITSRLGRRASHGCVRLSKQSAITLWHFTKVGDPVECR